MEIPNLKWVGNREEKTKKSRRFEIKGKDKHNLKEKRQ